MEFDTPDEELDHSWHEFESVELTSKSSENMKTIDDFLQSITEQRKESDSDQIKKFVVSGEMRNLFETQLKDNPDLSTFIADQNKEVKLETLIGKIERDYS